MPSPQKSTIVFFVFLQMFALLFRLFQAMSFSQKSWNCKSPPHPPWLRQNHNFFQKFEIVGSPVQQSINIIITTLMCATRCTDWSQIFYFSQICRIGRSWWDEWVILGGLAGSGGDCRLATRRAVDFINWSRGGNWALYSLHGNQMTSSYNHWQ